MEITTRQGDGGLELVLAGRLDAYWSDHLSKALDEAVRGGTHRLRLDMSAVPYMSSVGIRVLLRFYKETQRLGGSFAVCRPSEAVQRVLHLAGLESLLGDTAAGADPAAAPASMRIVERETATYEVFDLPVAGPVRCHVVGDTAPLEGCQYTESAPRLTCRPTGPTSPICSSRRASSYPKSTRSTRSYAKARSRRSRASKRRKATPFRWPSSSRKASTSAARARRAS
jgi:anti-anti-sigma factor